MKPSRAERGQEVSDGRARAEADEHPVLDEAGGRFRGYLLLMLDAHPVGRVPPMRSRRSALCLAVASAAAVLVAGCGGGGSSATTSSTTSEAVPTDTWANGFCSAFSDWANSLKDVAQTFQSAPTKASLQSAADD